MSKRKTHRNKDHAAPSKVLLAARLSTGAGKHQETKEKSKARKGRLSGSEKRKVMDEYRIC